MIWVDIASIGGVNVAGWIKLHRKMLDNPVVCKDSDHLAVWTYLLLNATHSDYPEMFNGKKIILKPGQLITGRKVISVKFKISESKVQRILKLFENEQQIAQQTGNKNRLITILSWEDYQGREHQNEQQLNNKRTTSEQQVNTYKNNKNIKNEINNTTTITTGQNDVVKFYEQNVTPFVSPVVQEKIIDWVNELGEDIVKYSFEIMATANVKDFRFANKILNDWYMDGVRTLEQAKEAQRQFQDRRQSKQTNVTHFPKKTSKPKLESFKPTGTGGMSDDEYKKAMELARMLDES